MTTFIEDLLGLIGEIKALASQDHPSIDTTVRQDSPKAPAEKDILVELDLKSFFATVRKSLFGGRLQSAQVSGMEAKLRSFLQEGYPLSWASYALATSYHETARRMVPVREGLSASEAWRQKHLRYYPYYGRGDVQLTWRENYERVDRELGLKGSLLKDLDLALDPDISAKVIAKGMKNGWFSKGQTLAKHLPDRKGTKASSNLLAGLLIFRTRQI